MFLSALFLLPPLAWRTLSAGLVALAAWEWAGLRAADPSRRIAYGMASGLLSWVLPSAPREFVALVFSLAALFWLAVVPLWLHHRWRLASPSGAVLAGWLVLLPPGLALVTLRENGNEGPYVLLSAMALVWIADIAAYFVGRRFGRRKLAAAISPGKTWEGVGGAAVSVLLCGFGAAWAAGLGERASVPWAIVLALLLLGMTAVGIVGDLFESLLKRQAGVKDSGRLLPGHGGLLDRIDSLTSTLPLAGLAVIWWRG